MKFSVPTIAMLASSASITSATEIVKYYIASPPSAANATATDSGAGSRRLDYPSYGAKSSKASGKSGKANPTGLESYTVCAQATGLYWVTSSEDLDPDFTAPSFFIPLSLELDYSSSGKFALSELSGNLGCEWFGLNSTACDDDGTTAVLFKAFTSTGYAKATGGNPLEFSAAGGVFLDPFSTTAGKGLVTTYSLKCATPPVTKFETKEGVRPVNICSYYLGIQNTELDLISDIEATIALYDESDGVECEPLTEDE
jgi:hypothetical protein